MDDRAIWLLAQILAGVAIAFGILPLAFIVGGVMCRVITEVQEWLRR